MRNKEPPIIFIRKSDKEHFERLLEKDSPFRKKENKHVFLMAMVFGFKNGVKQKLINRDPGGFIRTEYLTDKEKSLIEAIAVHDARDLDILMDKKKVYSIAEEYAAGGIKILRDEVFSAKHGSFHKRLESELVTLMKKVGSKRSS